jgi:hypothetical protein
LGLLRDIAREHKTVSLVGMAKNAGKTTAMNYLIAQAEDEGVRLGVTSTGRDGESVDVVTGTEKPKVYLTEDTLVAVPAGLYDLSGAGLEILRMTEFSSPLGQVMLCRVAEAGYVQVAGPVTTAGQRRICAEMLAAGVDLVLIDGAIDRKSIAAPDASDAIILSTGAALSRNMTKAAEETGYATELFGLPVLEDAAAREAIAARPDRLLAIGSPAGGAAGGALAVPLEMKTGLRAGARIREALAVFDKAEAGGGARADKANEGGGGSRGGASGADGKSGAGMFYIYVPGALTDGMLSGLEPKTLSGAAFVVTDPTKIFLDRLNYKRLKARGLRIFTMAGVKVAAVTVNPTSPEGYSFDSGEFIEAVRAVTGGIPVIDVRM